MLSFRKVGASALKGSVRITGNARTFSSLQVKFQEAQDVLVQYKRQLQDQIDYEKSPANLKKFVYKQKHAEKVLRAELFDPKTGRPFRPKVHPGPPKASLLNLYLKQITTFEELVEAKKLIRQFDEIHNYLNSAHLINFLIKSGELGKVSFGLKTVYDLSPSLFDAHLVRFINFLLVLKSELEVETSFNTVQRKLSVAPTKASLSSDPQTLLLQYTAFGSILINNEFAHKDIFERFTQELPQVISKIEVSEIPDFTSYSVGKRQAIYNSLRFEHLYLTKSSQIISKLSENDALNTELKSLVDTKFADSIAKLNNLNPSEQDFLTHLESQLQFTKEE